ncbi:UNVERIFIED_CONTAM: hypothetical protein Cloal_4315 [Acetivibrio alkalicellulosi]
MLEIAIRSATANYVFDTILGGFYTFFGDGVSYLLNSNNIDEVANKNTNELIKEKQYYDFTKRPEDQDLWNSGTKTINLN